MQMKRQRPTEGLDSMTGRIDMKKNKALVGALNELLADSIVFAQKLHHYHWRVRGESFYQLHARFEELYDRFGDLSDEFAERILMIGGAPLGSLAQALEAASVQEDESVPGARAMVENVRADLQAFHAKVRAAGALADDAGDKGSAAVLDPIGDHLEKELWMLGAYLDG